MAERWHPVIISKVQWPYSVSSTGRIRSDRTGRIMRLRRHSAGYLSVSLRYLGASRELLVHRLVALAFVTNPNPASKTFVHHRDGRKRNNAVNNLAWVSRSENMKHHARAPRTTTQRARITALIANLDAARAELLELRDAA